MLLGSQGCNKVGFSSQKGISEAMSQNARFDFLELFANCLSD